jgi:hypothetical protein
MGSTFALERWVNCRMRLPRHVSSRGGTRREARELLARVEAKEHEWAERLRTLGGRGSRLACLRWRTYWRITSLGTPGWRIVRGLSNR